MTIKNREDLALALAEGREPMKAGSEAVESLTEKFRMLKTGDQLMFCISLILGVDWVTHPRAMGGLSITSDGFVVSGGLFIGSADELVRNLAGASEAVGLNEAEKEAFRDLFYNTVTDWRMDVDHEARLYGKSPYTREAS